MRYKMWEIERPLLRRIARSSLAILLLAMLATVRFKNIAR
jgi:hypothetical protein